MSRFIRDGQPPPATDRRGLRRVVAGATVGTALEWYDFFIYGTAAPLVFGDLVLRPRLRLGHAGRLRHLSASASWRGRSAACSSATSATASGGARR
jgi:hypothetical protein